MTAVDTELTPLLFGIEFNSNFSAFRSCGMIKNNDLQPIYQYGSYLLEIIILSHHLAFYYA